MKDAAANFLFLGDDFTFSTGVTSSASSRIFRYHILHHRELVEKKPLDVRAGVGVMTINELVSIPLDLSYLKGMDAVVVGISFSDSEYVHAIKFPAALDAVREIRSLSSIPIIFISDKNLKQSVCNELSALDIDVMQGTGKGNVFFRNWRMQKTLGIFSILRRKRFPLMPFQLAARGLDQVTPQRDEYRFARGEITLGGTQIAFTNQQLNIIDWATKSQWVGNEYLRQRVVAKSRQNTNIIAVQRNQINLRHGEARKHAGLEPLELIDAFYGFGIRLNPEVHMKLDISNTVGDRSRITQFPHHAPASGGLAP